MLTIERQSPAPSGIPQVKKVAVCCKDCKVSFSFAWNCSMLNVFYSVLTCWCLTSKMSSVLACWNLLISTKHKVQRRLTGMWLVLQVFCPKPKYWRSWNCDLMMALEEIKWWTDQQTESNAAISGATMLAWLKYLTDPEWHQIPGAKWWVFVSLPALPCFSEMSCQQSRRVCSDHRYWCCPMCRSGRCSPSCCRPNYRRRETEEKEE